MYLKVYSNASIPRSDITILSRHRRSQDAPRVGQEQQHDVWSSKVTLTAWTMAIALHHAIVFEGGIFEHVFKGVCI